MRRIAWVLAVAVAIPVPGVVSAHPLPGAPRCPVFPPDNPWNQRVDQLPAVRDSAALIASIGFDRPLHPDFGTVWDRAPNGIPFMVVSNHTRRVPIRFQYAAESGHGRYPIPPNAPIEGGRERTAT